MAQNPFILGVNLGNVDTPSPSDLYQTYVLVTYGGLSGIRIRDLLNSASEEPPNSPPPPKYQLQYCLRWSVCRFRIAESRRSVCKCNQVK